MRVYFRHMQRFDSSVHDHFYDLCSSFVFGIVSNMKLEKGPSMSSDNVAEREEQQGVPVVFRCPRDLAEAADRAAAQELLSRSAFARRALRDAVLALGIKLAAAAQ
jgi:hypothetical protein